MAGERQCSAEAFDYKQSDTAYWYTRSAQERVGVRHTARKKNEAWKKFFFFFLQLKKFPVIQFKLTALFLLCFKWKHKYLWFWALRFGPQNGVVWNFWEALGEKEETGNWRPDILYPSTPCGMENRTFALHYLKSLLKVTWERKLSKGLLIPFGFG